MYDLEKNFLFNYSHDDVFEVFGHLAYKETASRNSAVRISFSDKLPIGSGSTHDRQSPIHVFVGVENVSKMDKISDRDMLELFRVFYHELRHVDHRLYKFETCGAYVSDMRIDYIACDRNNCFYGIRDDGVPADDYWHNIREIDCEMYAFNRMRDLLKDKELFPNVKDADEVMVEYTNNRLFRKSAAGFSFRVLDSYLKPDVPFKSISGIQDLYKETMKDCVLRGNKNYNATIDPGSELSCVLKSGGKWPTVRTWMSRNKDGSVRTKIAASVMLRLHPEYIDELGVTSDEEAMLDFKSLLGIEQPRISRLAMHKAKRQESARQIREHNEIVYYSGGTDDEFEV